MDPERLLELPGPRSRGVSLSSSFHLEIAGISAASFVRCTGLAAQRAVLAYYEGGAAAPHLLPGPEEPGSFRLERGVVRDHSLFDWYRKMDRRAGAVVLLGREGREVARWGFRRGWPRSWSGPAFDAGVSEIALEGLEIVHEGLEWLTR